MLCLKQGWFLLMLVVMVRYLNSECRVLIDWLIVVGELSCCCVFLVWVKLLINCMMLLWCSFFSFVVVMWVLFVVLFKLVLCSQVKNWCSLVRYWYEVVREWWVFSWYLLIKFGSCFSFWLIKLRYCCVFMFNFFMN